MILHRYGGIFERGSREFTLDDFYSLQLDKLDKYVCLKPLEIDMTAGDVSSSEEDDDDDESSQDEEEEEEGEEGDHKGNSSLRDDEERRVEAEEDILAEKPEDVTVSDQEEGFIEAS